MVKKLKVATQHEFVELPKSAKVDIPDWYKRSSNTSDGGPVRIDKNGDVNSALKMCVPFLDSMMSGYTVHTWQDVQVTIEQGVPMVTWRTKPDVIGARNSSFLGHLPTPAGHNDLGFFWRSEVVMQTPPGYSLLITHPFNRFDLPFTTLSALVDADSVMHEGGVPFFIKEGFEGVIPAGTPMFQVLPFKRDNWKSEEDVSILKVATSNSFKTAASISGWYKKAAWKRKFYN